MATLKMYTNDGNHIWLPNVKRVAQMFFIDDESCTSEDYPWEVAHKYLEKIKKSNSRLYEIIDQRIKTCVNKAALTSAVQHMQVLHVILSEGGEETSQNWVVQSGQNYLLENGKTVDRI